MLLGGGGLEWHPTHHNNWSPTPKKVGLGQKGASCHELGIQKAFVKVNAQLLRLWLLRVGKDLLLSIRKALNRTSHRPCGKGARANREATREQRWLQRKTPPPWAAADTSARPLVEHGKCQRRMMGAELTASAGLQGTIRYRSQ